MGLFYLYLSCYTIFQKPNNRKPIKGKSGKVVPVHVMRAYVRGDGEYRSEGGLDLWSCTLFPYGDKEKQVRPTLCELRLDFLDLKLSPCSVVRYNKTIPTSDPDGIKLSPNYGKQNVISAL
jgi:hypothetical protein